MALQQYPRWSRWALATGRNCGPSHVNARSASPEEDSALGIACGVPKKIPADWQAVAGSRRKKTMRGGRLRRELSDERFRSPTESSCKLRM